MAHMRFVSSLGSNEISRLGGCGTSGTVHVSMTAMAPLPIRSHPMHRPRRAAEGDAEMRSTTIIAILAAATVAWGCHSSTSHLDGGADATGDPTDTHTDPGR